MPVPARFPARVIASVTAETKARLDSISAIDEVPISHVLRRCIDLGLERFYETADPEVGRLARIRSQIENGDGADPLDQKWLLEQVEDSNTRS